MNLFLLPGNRIAYPQYRNVILRCVLEQGPTQERTAIFYQDAHGITFKRESEGGIRYAETRANGEGFENTKTVTVSNFVEPHAQKVFSMERRQPVSAGVQVGDGLGYMPDPVWEEVEDYVFSNLNYAAIVRDILGVLS